jgi:hypothetical protein
MAQPTKTTKDTTTYRDEKLPRRQGWKTDRYEQRNAKATARRNITGGF